MPGYFVAEVDVKDPGRYEEYKRLAGIATKEMGGEYLVRGGDLKVLEGEEPRPRVVVIKFDSVEAAQRWYDSDIYAPARKIRRESAETDAYIIEGV